MTNKDEAFFALREIVMRKASEQLERHNQAGNPITRSQALRMVINTQLEKLTRSAQRLQNEGNEEKADQIRELIHYLPELLRELGVK